MTKLEREYHRLMAITTRHETAKRKLASEHTDYQAFLREVESEKGWADKAHNVFVRLPTATKERLGAEALAEMGTAFVKALCGHRKKT